MEKNVRPCQGDVYLAYLENIKGSRQRGYRPVVVLQNNILNKHSTSYVVVPLTSNLRTGDIHYLVRATASNGLSVDSVALCEQITTIGRTFFKSKIGYLDTDDFRGILSTLQNVFISQTGGATE